jgi:hypothetical protein
MIWPIVARLHRLLTQTNAVTVCEMLRDGLDVSELTTDVPDEFRSVIERFRGGFAAIEDAAKAAMQAYPGEKNIANPEDKKVYALYVLAHHADLAPVLFATVGGKNYDAIVWKMIRPRGDEEKTFKADEE